MAQYLQKTIILYTFGVQVRPLHYLFSSFSFLANQPVPCSLDANLAGSRTGPFLGFFKGIYKGFYKACKRVLQGQLDIGGGLITQNILGVPCYNQKYNGPPNPILIIKAPTLPSPKKPTYLGVLIMISVCNYEAFVMFCVLGSFQISHDLEVQGLRFGAVGLWPKDSSVS